MRSINQNSSLIHLTFIQGESIWEIDTEKGIKIFEAARLCDAPIKTLCHGIGACVRCKVKVLTGQLSPPQGLERDRLGNIFHLTQERLSCQAQVESGPIMVEIPRERRKRRR